MSRPNLIHRPSSVAAANKKIILVVNGNLSPGIEIVSNLAKKQQQQQSTTTNQVLLGCQKEHLGEEAAVSMGAPINVNPIKLDIQDDKSIEQCSLAIEQTFGKLDVLIYSPITTTINEPNTLGRKKFDSEFGNVSSLSLILESLIKMLNKSKKPKVIILGSSDDEKKNDLIKVASNAAMDVIIDFYSQKFQDWEIDFVHGEDEKNSSQKVLELVSR